MLELRPDLLLELAELRLGAADSAAAGLGSVSSMPGSAETARAPARTRDVPRLALTPAEAAFAIGMSVDTFDRHVRAELRLVRRGAKVLVPVSELERWLEANAERVLP